MVDGVNVPEAGQALTMLAEGDLAAGDLAVAVEQIVLAAQAAAVDAPPERVVAYEAAQRGLRQLLDQVEG